MGDYHSLSEEEPDKEEKWVDPDEDSGLLFYHRVFLVD